jgi:hypothetical protein
VLNLTRLALDPRFDAVRPGLAALAWAGSVEVGALDRALGPLAGIRFEPQHTVRRRGEPFASAASYDGRITLAGAVPTRPGSLHDLMNALVWASFPRSKRAIHARQLSALSAEVDEGAAALPGRRSRLRDRLSMLDEGGLLLLASGPHAPLEEALSRSDVPELARRRARGELAAWVFGHAILEHAAEQAALSVRASAVLLAGGPSLVEADAALASALDEDDEGLERWLGRWPSIDAAALLAPSVAVSGT